MFPKADVKNISLGGDGGGHPLIQVPPLGPGMAHALSAECSQPHPQVERKHHQHPAVVHE